MAVYPQNSQFMSHFGEFLKDGYRVSAEAVQVKFVGSDSSRVVGPGTVGICDGYLKVLCMFGFVLICHELEPCLTHHST